MTIEWIHPDELRNHPTNISLYGDTPDPQFLESIEQHGVFQHCPIGYVQDGDFKVIVSGHRRNQAAKIGKLDMVPVVRLKDIEGDELAIKEMIVRSNASREKTREQLAREAALLAEIEGERSVVRQRGGRVETSQKVAETLKTSQRSAERLIKSGKALVKAEAAGETEKAEKIKKGLRKSVKAGADAADDKPPKNGSVATPTYDDKKIDKPLGVIRRELDERLKVFPATERLMRAAKHALSQFCDRLTEWRDAK